MEYVGEIVSQDEGERRGRIADKNNLSYIFKLNDDRYAHQITSYPLTIEPPNRHLMTVEPYITSLHKLFALTLTYYLPYPYPNTLLALTLT